MNGWDKKVVEACGSHSVHLPGQYPVILPVETFHVKSSMESCGETGHAGEKRRSDESGIIILSGIGWVARFDRVGQPPESRNSVADARRP
jgi:hypothetical protein